MDRSWEYGRHWWQEMVDMKSVQETRFKAAIKVIQSLPKNGLFWLTHEMMLKFYSICKQANEGAYKLSRPGFLDPIGRYKWDAWSSLGGMTKEEVMIAYVEEMKKIIETTLMTEKEELLHAIGPFYEIVGDKKSGRSSDLTSDLGNALTSTPSAKTVIGKAESPDSGAESEEEEFLEEAKAAEQSDTDMKVTTKSGKYKNLKIIVNNGYGKDSFIQDIQDDIQAISSLNGGGVKEVKPVEQNLEQTGKIAVCIQQDINDDHVEDISGTWHLTSDSDSEVYCDYKEQFGQEESLDNFTSSSGIFQYYMGSDPNKPLDNSVFSEAVQGPPGTGNIGTMQVAAVEGKGEVKHGGEDGRSNSGAAHEDGDMEMETAQGAASE
ncbi:Acyl-CoA-binding domain-containing protein 5 [Fukomys damarensis]|uniref:Acyl-CoA-binding domain-containing protein 5 n=1 Tax=Fukomys damarensis TaxID=885580 RepID=A0A091EGB3_FUKDA|nr:Acyl-CoA-binding domain-containing protein 5 [Fukomys damarensis]